MTLGSGQLGMGLVEKKRDPINSSMWLVAANGGASGNSGSEGFIT